MRGSGPESFRLHVVFALLAVALFGLPSHAFGCFPIAAHIRVGADTTHCQANDIQSAINAAGSCPVVIDITREHTYTDQHLSIDGKSITFQGWGDGVTCADIPDDLGFPPYTPPVSNVALVTLNGSGGGRVLSITGTSNVALRNIGITGGLTDDTATGGGIDFYGQGSLYLIYSVVNLNQAGYGGGINVNGASGPASLALDTYSQILVNTATHSGGGIRMLGQSRLFATKPQTLIGFNHADNGYGGGIEVLGPARADIGSPGFNGLGVINGNTAAYGGGVDILTFEDGADANVRLFTTDPYHPVQITDNFASRTGGAFYLKPLSTLSEFTKANLCAYDFRINDNAAQEGSAIYSDADYSAAGNIGGYVTLNPPEEDEICSTQPEPPTTLGAVSCASGVACNELVGNIAEDSDSRPTAGSTILIQNAGQLNADRFSARANTGAHVVRELADRPFEGFAKTQVELSNCLLSDNVVTQELVAQTEGDYAFLTIYACTIAGNDISAPFSLLAPGGFTLFSSIIDQPGRGTVDPPITDSGSAKYVLATDRASLPDTVYVVQGEPIFADAAHGDYHQTVASPGVDFGNSIPTYLDSFSHLDLDRNPRVVDLPTVTNNFGAMDLGAYELQRQFACGASDTIFLRRV